MCQVLDILGRVPWSINNKVLETMEYVWSIGGGLGSIPNRYNARSITSEMIRDSDFTEKLKLLKEHQ
jgi:DNA-directed RNA polymerase